MSIFDSIFKKSKQLPKSKKLFQTSEYGGIKVDVESLLNSNLVRIEGYCKNKYLKNLVINPKDDMKIGNYIVLIINFGIVNNTQLVYSSEEVSRTVIFQFCDAKKYMYDITGDDIRLNQIEASNSFCFTGII